MSSKKQQQAPRVATGAHIENVHIQNGSIANEFTRDGVVALAKAIEKNAEAAIEVARALKGAPANMECGIRLDNIRGTE